MRDLGVALDQELIFTEHVKTVYVEHSIFYQLLQISIVRQSLSVKAASTLMYSFISTTVDCGNVIYAGLSLYLSRINQFQSVLNDPEQLSDGIPKFGPVSNYMRDEQHWFPMWRRIEFKIFMLFLYFLAGCAPYYLRELYVFQCHSYLAALQEGDLLIASPVLPICNILVCPLLATHSMQSATCASSSSSCAFIYKAVEIQSIW